MAAGELSESKVVFFSSRQRFPGNACLRPLVLVPAPRRTNFDLAQSGRAMALIEVMAMHIPHELQDEFPQEASLIERTIRTNYEFRRLAVRYDAVNRNIYSIESGEEPTTDEVLTRLKKQRLKLKDEIAAILTKLEHRM